MARPTRRDAPASTIWAAMVVVATWPAFLWIQARLWRRRSLAVLARAKAAGLTAKSGIILGMGDDTGGLEVKSVMRLQALPTTPGAAATTPSSCPPATAPARRCCA